MYALITGSSKGIGKAIAIELAKRKYNLLLVARSESLLQQLSVEISQQFGVKVAYLALDLAQPQAAQQVANWVEKEGYPLSILVNNAGYGLSGLFESQTVESNRDMMQLNMVLVSELCQVLLPTLKKQPKAYILNVSSTTAYQALPLMSLYAATKVFVLNFTRGLCYELQNTSVSVTVLCPGTTDTAFIDRANVSNKARKNAEKVAMTPEAVAKIGVDGMFAGKAEVIAGFINKLGAAGAWLLPKTLIEKIGAGLYEE
jgi:uncharacterized protein